MVQWAEEVAKSERPSVMDGIGVMPRGESLLTCNRCDGASRERLLNRPRRAFVPSGTGAFDGS